MVEFFKAFDIEQVVILSFITTVFTLQVHDVRIGIIAKQKLNLLNQLILYADM